MEDMYSGSRYSEANMAITSIRIALLESSFAPTTDSPDTSGPQMPIDDDVLGSDYFIIYHDANGGQSQREILLRSVFWSDVDLCIGTFCFMRNSPRTFRVARISELIHGRTGEVISSPISFFSKVAPPHIGEISPQKLGYSERRTLRTFVRPAAIALMYLARSDKDLAPEEVEIVAELIEDGRSSLKLSKAAADDDLLTELTAIVPTGNLVTRAMRAIVEGEAYGDNLPKRLTRMARADGYDRPEEVQAYRDIIATLRRVSKGR